MASQDISSRPRDKSLSSFRGYRILCLVIFLILISNLASCGGDQSPQPSAANRPEESFPGPTKTKETQAASSKNAKVAAIKPPEKEDSLERYSPRGERDPFRPLLIPTKAQLQVSTIPLTPLQTYDTEALKVVGIIWGELGKRALILAPDGREYFARVGTLVGKNRGQVVNIDGNKVVVEEKVLDILGKESLRKVTLDIKREKEEG